MYMRENLLLKQNDKEQPISRLHHITRCKNFPRSNVDDIYPQIKTTARKKIQSLHKLLVNDCFSSPKQPQSIPDVSQRKNTQAMHMTTSQQRGKRKHMKASMNSCSDCKVKSNITRQDQKFHHSMKLHICRRLQLVNADHAP